MLDYRVLVYDKNLKRETELINKITAFSGRLRADEISDDLTRRNFDKYPLNILHRLADDAV